MAAIDDSEAAVRKGSKDNCGYLAFPAMGSGRQQVGRLQGGSCSNNNGGDVVVLAAARLNGGLRSESMWMRAGDGGQQTCCRPIILRTVQAYFLRARQGQMLYV